MGTVLIIFVLTSLEIKTLLKLLQHTIKSLHSIYDIYLIIENLNDSLHSVFNDGCFGYFVSGPSVCLSTTNIKYPPKQNFQENLQGNIQVKVNYGLSNTCNNTKKVI